MNVMISTEKELTLKNNAVNKSWLNTLQLKFTESEDVLYITAYQNVLLAFEKVLTFLKINNMYAEAKYQLKIVSDGSSHVLIQ